MRLRDWELECAYDPDLSGSMMTVIITPRRREAMITFSPRFVESPPAAQTYALVHELNHAHLRPAQDAVLAIQPIVGFTWPVVNASHDDAIESAAHKFAAMLAPYLPTFPQWLEAHINATNEGVKIPRLNGHGGGVSEPQRRSNGRVPTRKRRGAV